MDGARWLVEIGEMAEHEFHREPYHPDRLRRVAEIVGEQQIVERSQIDYREYSDDVDFSAISGRRQPTRPEAGSLMITMGHSGQGAVMIRRTLMVAAVHFAIGAALLLVFNQQPWSVSAALTLGFPFVWVCHVAGCPDWLSVQPLPLIEAVVTYALSSVTWGVVIGGVWTILAEARMGRERGLAQ